ncbi:MAG: protein tyrosine phosphatase family protein [Woeseiaceae bacterium]
MFKNTPQLIFPVVASSILLFTGCAADAQMSGDHSGPVMNYHRVDDRLVTGGHLLDGGTAELKEQGVKVVVDVRDNSPSGEEQRFAEQGIKWINVPVNWNNPQAADFDKFSAVMTEHQDAHVMVQCAANYRASAMTYLYRVVVEKVPEEEAEKDLHAVWNPDENDTWSDYIDEVKSAN